MDRAVTLQLAGQYAESNRYLQAAEARIESLFAVSISQQAGSFLINDTTLAYEGEDFEKVMIPILGALNYAALGEMNEALVEARKVDHLLSLLNDRYEKKNVYKEDALARYLSGILYEARGETNDAHIAYRKAYDAFRIYRQQYQTPIPPWIGADLLRTAHALGLTEEMQTYQSWFPETEWEDARSLREKGEAVLVTYVGRSPVKTNRFIDLPVPDGQGGIYPMRMAFPHFVRQPSQTRGIALQVEGSSQLSARGHLVEDVTAIAIKNLEDRIGRITAKTIARASAKLAASVQIRREAAKSNDPGKRLLADLSTGLFSLLTERADTRSWRTLPSEIYLARIPLPPGEYRITVRYRDGGGGLVEERSHSVSVKAGEKRFLIDRIP